MAAEKTVSAPTLPAGWSWEETRVSGGPFWATHLSAPLAIRRPRRGHWSPGPRPGWVAVVQGSVLRRKLDSGAFCIKQGTHKKGTKIADYGQIAIFTTPLEAAAAAVAFFTGARVRPAETP